MIGLLCVLSASVVLFTDRVPFTIEGTAAPHETVTVTIDPQASVTTTANRDGKWSVEWTEPLATGTYEVDIRGASGTTASILRVQLPGRLPRQPNVTAQPVLRTGVFEDTAENVEVMTRWRITPPPYELDEPSRGLLDPYNRNLWKGDYPIRGDDTFLVLTGISDSLAEARSDEGMVVQNVVVSADLYQGLTTFQPVQQRVKAALAGSVRVSTGSRGRLSVQELFYERKLRDLSPNYDFVSMRAGSQLFVSDFRGFIFADANPGIRLFGNYASNRYQYNVALFDRVAKERGTGLNRFERLRDQRVGVANFYWQDFLRPGYTQQVSLHHVRDDDLSATYLGLAGSGHLGRINVDNALYLVSGRDRHSDVRAGMAAAELSQHRDWLRPRIGFLYASGDGDPSDARARGFDSIHDAAAFAGGGFSFFSRFGSGLVERGSIFPAQRTEDGRPNYMNRGLQLITTGVDIDLTPRLEATLTANHLRFAAGGAQIGTDLSLGVRYRPFLNNHVVLMGGAAALVPEDQYHFFTNLVLQF